MSSYSRTLPIVIWLFPKTFLPSTFWPATTLKSLYFCFYLKRCMNQGFLSLAQRHLCLQIFIIFHWLFLGVSLMFSSFRLEMMRQLPSCSSQYLHRPRCLLIFAVPPIRCVLKLSLQLPLSVSGRGSAVLGEDAGNSWAPSLLIVGPGETSLTEWCTEPVLANDCAILHHYHHH